MSPPLVLSCVWVLAATGTALLPMRAQMIPGLALLVAAPPLLWAIAASHGLIPTLAALFAVLSMFRRPLFFATSRLMRAAAAREDDR